jgi:PAS domain S-box-containing protein
MIKIHQTNQPAAARDLTERQRAEAVLRESEERYRGLFEHMFEGFAYCRMLFEDGVPRDWIYLSVNKMFEKLTGLRNVTGKRVSEVIPGIAETDPELFRIYARVALTGKSERFEMFVQSLQQWFAISVYSPNKECFAAVFDVITERKQAEEAVRRNHEEFKDLFDNAPVGFHEINAEGRLVRINNTELKMLGYAAGELLGQFIWKISADEELSRRAVLSKLAGEVAPPSEGFERSFRRKDGSTFPVWIKDRVLKREDGIITGIRAGVQDITERKRAETELNRERDLWRALLENSPDKIYFKDPQSRFVECGRTMAIQFGVEFPEAMVGKTDFDFFHESHARPAFEDEQEIIRTGRPIMDKEEREDWKDGHVTWVSSTKLAWRDANGKIVGIMGISRDITARLQAEQQLAEALNFNRKIISEAPVGILVYKASGHCVLANESAAWALNASVSQLLEQDFRQIVSWRVSGMLHCAEEALTAKATRQCELNFLSTFGREVSLVCQFSPFVQNGEPHLLLVFDDVTEKKKLEGQFLRAQRMESIGTLAGGIAHDLNNVLAPLLVSVQLLKENLTDPERQKVLETLETNINRGASLVKQVLAFGRGINGERVMVQLKHIAREIKQIVQETFPKSVQFQLSIAPELRTIIGDATQIHQVLLNLCVNARDAMPEGGKLSVHLENVTLDPAYASLNLEAKPGPYVVIRVQDTGTGIPKLIRERIFDPFFTTKELGKGTGLGLSTSLAITKSHGGFIQCYSEPGKGSTFEVYLPAATMPNATESLTKAHSQLPRGHDELVLVVDDEAPIRKLAQKTLECFGYRVLLAANGADGAALYASRQHEIAVVITDMAMPVMDGPALIAALKAINPKVRIIGSSGLASGTGLSGNGDKRMQFFVAKPYSAETMLQALHGILHENSPENPAAKPEARGNNR